MNVCFVTSECVPFVKTGGLADVSGALPAALARLGAKVKVFLPLYGTIDPEKFDLTFVEDLKNLPVQLGPKSVSFNVWYRQDGPTGVEYYFIDYPPYYHRSKIYTSDPDEDERFILLQDATMIILQHLRWPADILHCNDWQTSLLPAYLKMKYNWDQLFTHTRSVLSIHNIGYQGIFGYETLLKTGLPEYEFYPTGPFEFHGKFSFLKTGIVFADVINTVSETYAREIQTPEYGAGMEGVLQTRKTDLYGILNGVDNHGWNPRTDPFIPYNYNLRNLRSKLMNKQALLERLNLPFNERTPVIGVVSRLVSQKGFDLVQPLLPRLMKHRLQMVVLGTGEPSLENFFRQAAATYPQQFATHIGFNNELAHLITAGADIFLMPSRYEPCGLNQMYSLMYGTVPVVRKTGGLADTVIDYYEHPDRGNGFTFKEYSPVALYQALERAISLFPQKAAWRELMKRGMKSDFSWKRSAQKYLQLYETALRKSSREMDLV